MGVQRHIISIQAECSLANIRKVIKEDETLGLVMQKCLWNRFVRLSLNGKV